MSRQNPEFKERLLKEDILSCISHAFEVFPSPSECDMLKQAVTLLGTLADDYALVTYQCIVEEFHLTLLRILTEFEASVSLLVATIETLGKKKTANIFLELPGCKKKLVTETIVVSVCYHQIILELNLRSRLRNFHS